MNHALALASAFSDFISLRSTVSTTFFRFRELFFIEAAKSFSSARCVKLLKARPTVNNFFPLFDFFHPLDALSSLRGVNLVKTTLAVNNFFAASEKNPLRDPFVRPSSTALAVPLSKPAPSGPCGVRPAREAFMDPFAPKVKAFFLFFEKIIFSALFQKVKRRFF